MVLVVGGHHTVVRGEAARLADTLARSLENREQLLKLLSMNNYDMEANSREEFLISFKHSYGMSLRLMQMSMSSSQGMKTPCRTAPSSVPLSSQ